MPYGACAYFSIDGTLERIYTSHDDRTQYPGDPSWEHAKWAWRTSLFTAVTLVDHLGATHYSFSNLLVRISRETLPPDHPVRRLLKAFTYGAVAINRDAARTLSNHRGIAHRLFAFTYESLVRLLLHGVEMQRFRTFPDSIAAMRVEALGDRFLYAADGLALYAVFNRYVDEYLQVYFTSNQLVEDGALRAFWRRLNDLAPAFALGALTHAGQVKDLFTQFMFTVTGNHAHVGGVVDYLFDPAFMGARIRPALAESDVQSTLQALNLTVLTGLRQPMLIGSYQHLLLDGPRHSDAVGTFERYQSDLEALAERIEDRNTHIEQPFQTFNPRILDTSVST